MHSPIIWRNTELYSICHHKLPVAFFPFRRLSYNSSPSVTATNLYFLRYYADIHPLITFGFPGQHFLKGDILHAVILSSNSESAEKCVYFHRVFSLAMWVSKGVCYFSPILWKKEDHGLLHEEEAFYRAGRTLLLLKLYKKS